jgi:Family of unknown function (DUF5985)
VSGAIYLLSAATCLLCAVLLLRSYAQRRVRLLLWSGLCFLGLMLENVMMYVDFVIYTDVNLAILRKLPAVIALSLLLFGLVWDSR